MVRRAGSSRSSTRARATGAPSWRRPPVSASTASAGGARELKLAAHPGQPLAGARRGARGALAAAPAQAPGRGGGAARAHRAPEPRGVATSWRARTLRAARLELATAEQAATRGPSGARRVGAAARGGGAAAASRPSRPLPRTARAREQLSRAVFGAARRTRAHRHAAASAHARRRGTAAEAERAARDELAELQEALAAQPADDPARDTGRELEAELAKLDSEREAGSTTELAELEAERAQAGARQAELAGTVEARREALAVAERGSRRGPPRAARGGGRCGGGASRARPRRARSSRR